MTDEKDKKIAELQAEVHTLKTILLKMPGHIYWKDINGRYLGCNDNVAKLLNINSPTEAIGKTDEELIESPFSDAIRKIDLEVMENQCEIHTEEVGPESDGTLSYYLTQKAPLFDITGNINGTFGISLNITARKQIEEKLIAAKKKAEAANRAKSKFLAMVSHELRTPLTSILGFVSFLENEHIDTIHRKQYIQYIIESGSYLLSLINNLLDYNKLDTNKYELTVHQFNIKKLANDVVNMLSSSAKIKNISLTMSHDQKVPEYVIGDSHVLQQILVNLVANAIKFTDEGYVKVILTCIHQTSDIVDIHISVEDSGAGIAPDELKSIFKRFYQSGNVYTRNQSLSGTGLGLSIVKKLVKLLKSKINVKSTVNQGSSFFFTIKLPIVSSQSLFTNLSSTISTSNLHKNSYIYNVLLIEDDVLIQIVHKQMLEELGCKVDIAECAQNALDKINTEYDIIFVDIGLPDMSGFELIKVLRENLHVRDQTPIVALTGYSEEDERIKCHLAGANRVAIKPISKTALGELLEGLSTNEAVPGNIVYT